MKKVKIFLSSILLMFNYSCYSGLDYYYTLEPIYTSSESFKSKIVLTDAKEIRDLSKVYKYKNYLFISEKNAGVHIYDNKNPRVPINKFFLRIPFNEGISIKNDTLYSDALGEITAIDISNIENNKIEILDKINLHFIDTNSNVKVGYKRSKLYFKSNFTISPPLGINTSNINNINSNEYVSPSNPYNNTIETYVWKSGDTYSLFALGEYLYSINKGLSNFNLFDIKNDKKIENRKYEDYKNTLEIKKIETIYQYQDKLFMLSNKGTYIYDNKNPPNLISKLENIKSSDSLVLEGKKAYVTLKNTNSLNIIDLSDINSPKLIKSYPLILPSCLVVDNSKLFVCDSNSLKVLDVTDLENITEINKYNINEPKDIILTDKKEGIILAKDGVHQLDLSDPNRITEISHIKVENNISLFDFWRDIYLLEEDDSNLKENYIREGKDTYYYKWYKEYFSDIK